MCDGMTGTEREDQSGPVDPGIRATYSALEVVNLG